MKPLILTIAILTLAPVAAAAEDLTALFSGNEIRRADREADSGLRYDRWDFAANGTFADSFTIEFGAGSDTAYEETGSVSGRWRIADGNLCVTDEGPRGSGEVCYVLKQINATDSSIEFTGSEVGGGHKWRFDVPRRGG